MRKLSWIAGGVVSGLVVLLLVLRVVGFNPGVTSPGLWITGKLVTTPVTDWSFADEIGGLTAVQTRQWFLPILAHSVTTARQVHRGRLYLFSMYPAGVPFPEGRHWNRNVISDPGVRIGIGGKLYDRTLVYLTDPVEREEVLRARGQRAFAPGMYLHLWRVEPLAIGE